MPSILIVPESGDDAVVERFKLREHVSASDMEDAHICAQLLQRIGWAVEDAEREEEGARSRSASRRGAGSGD